MPSCINRMLGNPSDAPAHPTLPEALVEVSKRAGLPVWIPDDVAGHCCGMPWSSKGFAAGHARMSERVRDAIARWSGPERLPLVIDATSCAHSLISEVSPAGVEVRDSISWVHDHLLDRLEPARKLTNIVVHPNCSSRHLGLIGKLIAIADRLADEVVLPAGTGCCGMAGDRGILHPELPASALRDVAAELRGRSFNACVSSNRTCEIALEEITGLQYTSFVFVLEELTRP
jgi:D-lactate dehydrogenase